jgi:hypothetical protein
MNMRKLLVLSLFAAATVLNGQRAAAATIIWVGDCGQVASFATIQAAVDAASPGDTVSVCPGVYTENVIINKAALRVVSTGGASVTTIMAATSTDVVAITQPGVTLVGFTLLPAGSVAKHDIGVNVAIQGNASAELAHNVIRGGRIGVNLGCSSSGSTVYHNVVKGAAASGINIDTCEDPNATRAGNDSPGSTFNSVHHNAVCGGLSPYSIALGNGSDFNAVHHNIAKWITVSGDGNLVHDNTAHLFNISPGSPANAIFNNFVATVCP